MRWLIRLFRKRKIEHQLDSELRFHIEQRTADLIANGVTPTEARRHALIEFGGIERAKEECREARGWSFAEDTWRDICYGVRMLRKSPGFTTVAVLTLALGIGANTAIFSVVDAAFLSSLPVRDPGRLVVLQWRAHEGPRASNMSGYGDCGRVGGSQSTSGCSFSYPMYAQIRARRSVFAQAIAFAGAGQLDLSGNGPASIVQGRLVSGNFFGTLGVRAVIGRLIEPSDDRTGAAPVVVLSYRLWQSAFGGSPSVIGRSIRLNNVVFTIVGVADPRFAGITPGSLYDLWVPLSQTTPLRVAWVSHSRHDPGNWWLVIVGRLKTGVSLSQAQAAVSLLFRNDMLHGAKPLFTAQADPRIVLLRAREGLTGGRAYYEDPLLVLMLSVGIVLLIACANVAGLTLARSASRQKEMAVRLALGAGPLRIARQLLSENLLLAALGGLIGFLFAYWGVHAFISMEHSQLRVSPDLRILGFTAAISVLTGILAGSAPAFRGPRVDLVPSLKEGGGGFPGGARPRGRWFSAGNALVVAQVALAVVLLAGAGLLIRTLENLESLNPGFDTKSVLLFGVDPALLGYNASRTESLYAQLQQRLAALPGVASVGYSTRALLSHSLSETSVYIEGQPGKSRNVDILGTGLGFFSTLRIPLVAGREFDSADFARADAAAAAREADKSLPPPISSHTFLSPREPPSASSKVSALISVLVNEAFVRQFLGKRNPLGVTIGEDKNGNWEIVGVVGDAKYSNLRRAVHPTVYVPLAGGGAHFELRTAVSPESLIPAVRGVVEHVDPELPLFGMKTQTQTIQQLLSSQRLFSQLLGFFAFLALLLACLGLYGLLSYEVARRTREIGIRMALGAQRSSVFRLVVGEGLALALVGGAIGIAVSLGVTRYLGSLLYGVRPGNPAILIGVVALITLVAALACYVPARKAMRVDPNVALRQE
jgi:predicted permease